MATLEFITRPSAALEEMNRCLTPAGRLVIGTLNRNAPLNRRRVLQHHRLYASARMFTPRELRTFLEPYGEVRMLASVVGRRTSRCLVKKPSGREIDLPRRSLKGPFIVAEVRT